MGDKFKGSEIHKRGDDYYFDGTGEKVSETWKDMPCGFCGKHNTPEGHDACLGTIPGAINACCGHGVVRDAYIQFDNGTCIRGEGARQYLPQHIGGYDGL